MNPDPITPWNPFAVLGLPEWPDLDDETVQAAWVAIAAQADPARPDGGDPARYAQATAAYHELDCPWGRSEAFADLLDRAWAEGRYDAYPGHYPPGWEPDDPGPYPVGPGGELGVVPWSEVARVVAEIPSRFRRGHPWRLAIRAAVTAGLCLAALAIWPRGPVEGISLYLLIGLFAVSAREDMAPLSRPVRRNPPAGSKQVPPAGPRAPGWAGPRQAGRP